VYVVVTPKSQPSWLALDLGSQAGTWQVAKHSLAMDTFGQRLDAGRNVDVVHSLIKKSIVSFLYTKAF